MGEAEAAIERTFKSAAARAPSLILFDDIDLICPHRGGGGGGSEPATEDQKRLVSCLLSLVDGVMESSGVFIIGEWPSKVMITARR